MYSSFVSLKNTENLKNVLFGPKLAIDKISQQNLYICSLHFLNGSRPTSDHPVPIPATATKYDVYQAINVL